MINKQRNDDGLQKKTDEQNEQKFGKEFMLFDFFSNFTKVPLRYLEVVIHVSSLKNLEK